MTSIKPIVSAFKRKYRILESLNFKMSVDEDGFETMLSFNNFINKKLVYSKSQINKIGVSMLINTRVTNSFMMSTYVKILKLEVEGRDLPMKVNFV